MPDRSSRPEGAFEPSAAGGVLFCPTEGAAPQRAATAGLGLEIGCATVGPIETVDADGAQRSGADDPRRCQGTLDRRYVEDEENDPDWLAEEAVVIWVKLPDTDAFVPEAEL